MALATGTAVGNQPLPPQAIAGFHTRTIECIVYDYLYRRARKGGAHLQCQRARTCGQHDVERTRSTAAARGTRRRAHVRLASSRREILALRTSVRVYANARADAYVCEPLGAWVGVRRSRSGAALLTHRP